MLRRWLHLILLLAGLSSLGAAGAQTKPPIVAAASDLKFAVTEIAARFEAETGRKVALNFGSSGNFARQIQQGAPFELFMSADEEYAFRLADAGLTRDRGSLYARGRIALYAPKGSKLGLDPELNGLRAGLQQGAAMASERRVGQALISKHGVERGGEGAGFRQHRQQQQRRHCGIPREVFEPSGDDRRRLVAINQRRAQRRIGMGPANRGRERTVAPVRDPCREQSHQQAAREIFLPLSRKILFYDFIAE